MKCKNAQHLFFDAFLDQLDEKRGSAFYHHLQSCELCKITFERQANLWNQLADLPELAPDPQAEQRFGIMLEQAKRDIEIRRISRLSFIDRIRSMVSMQPVPGVAMSLVLLIIGFVIGTTVGTQTFQNDKFSQLSTELNSMRQLVMLSLLKHESSVERLEGINWSYEIKNPSHEVMDALYNTLESDPNVNVRLSALRALSPLASQNKVSERILKSFDAQRSPLVQTEIVGFLVRNNTQNAIPILRQLESRPKLDTFVEKYIQQNINALERSSSQEARNENML